MEKHPSIHTEKINISEVVKEIFPSTLIKDLTEYERICPVCKGLGIRIDDNIYGIKGDKSKSGKRKHLSYKNQALSFCPSCFNGVQSLCPYCGKPYKNQPYSHCDCEGQKKADKEEQIKAWNEKVFKAVKINESDVNTMLYCKEFDKYYSTVEDFFSDYAVNYTNDTNKPERLWVCGVEKIHIDADSVVESACEELHEDAYEECDIDSLQQLLDNWCSEQTRATTYYPSYDKYVIIDWKQYPINNN